MPGKHIYLFLLRMFWGMVLFIQYVQKMSNNMAPSQVLIGLIRHTGHILALMVLADMTSFGFDLKFGITQQYVIG